MSSTGKRKRAGETTRSADALSCTPPKRAKSARIQNRLGGGLASSIRTGQDTTGEAEGGPRPRDPGSLDPAPPEKKLRPSARRPTAFAKEAGTDSREEQRSKHPGDGPKNALAEQATVPTPTSSSPPKPDEPVNSVEEPAVLQTGEDDCVEVSPEVVAKARSAVLCRLSELKPPIRLVGLEEQYGKVYNLLEKTVRHGESNSLLLVGNRGTGKSTVVRLVLDALRQKYQMDGAEGEICLEGNDKHRKHRAFLEIRLSGLVQTDDRLALREILRQLALEREFENQQLSKSADVIPLIFILDDMDLFAQHPKQSLLYNLFDAVQSSKSPIGVLGTTCRIDAIDLLEKRVKSRFSHRHVHFYAAETLARFTETLEATLCVGRGDGLPINYVSKFNDKIKEILVSSTAVREVFNFSKDLRALFKMFFSPVGRLSAESPFLVASEILATAISQRGDQKLQKIRGILREDPTVFRICLLVAIKQHVARQVESFNFEMVYDEYREFFQRVSIADRESKDLLFVKPVALKVASGVGIHFAP
ncbi:origin recognition complex subunit 4 [Borealophlyctis nickersoniae]|nr:origin recognition complex subunit 4 [Borealophlyctis nickersoniae]